jgi:penicillin amidase
VGVENEEYRVILEGWDYQAGMDSPAAALFEVFWKNLMELTFMEELPEGTEPDGGSRWFEVFADLVQRPDDAWWDIPSTAPVENRDFIFSMAFTQAVNELKNTLGDDASKWAWGDLHTLELVNPSLGSTGIGLIDALFNRGGYQISGGTAIVNATGWSATKDEPYAVRSLPSMRMIVDLNQLSDSLSIHTTGQSGHAYHEHYVDMTDPWRNIEYKGMLWDREQLEAEGSAYLELVP